jgi:hypothetical protein
MDDSLAVEVVDARDELCKQLLSVSIFEKAAG